MSPRLSRRLLRHHLPLALVALVPGWLLYVTRTYPDVLTRLSFASAWPALVLLSVTLIIGPLRVLRGKPQLLSQDFRRDIGIWAGITGVFHAVVGQCVHLRGRPWLYYIYEKTEEHLVPLRHDMFGFANFTGLFAALILLVLLATSNDASLRKMGAGSWKGLQRWNYACFALATCHTFGYLLGIESMAVPAIATAAICVMLTAALQVTAYYQRLRL